VQPAACFFFSSRRRHTRLVSDWSSDVCSSDLATAAAWQTWLAGQHLTGNGAVPDYANPEQMNRYTWYQAHGWKVPYPGDSKIYQIGRASCRERGEIAGGAVRVETRR